MFRAELEKEGEMYHFASLDGSIFIEVGREPTILDRDDIVELFKRKRKTDIDNEVYPIRIARQFLLADGAYIEFLG